MGSQETKNKTLWHFTQNIKNAYINKFKVCELKIFSKTMSNKCFRFDLQNLKII